ncbi:MAG: hypothetical protein Q4C47_06325, partial [Planctomycetia bacterium]|nr:hypothetical protein [Planctomycetia bacterium]
DSGRSERRISDLRTGMNRMESVRRRKSSGSPERAEWCELALRSRFSGAGGADGGRVLREAGSLTGTERSGE